MQLRDEGYVWSLRDMGFTVRDRVRVRGFEKVKDWFTVRDGVRVRVRLRVKG